MKTKRKLNENNTMERQENLGPGDITEPVHKPVFSTSIQHQGVEASLFMLHNAISFLDVCTSLCFLGGGCSQGVCPHPQTSLNSSQTIIPTTTGMPCTASAGGVFLAVIIGWKV